MFFFTFLNPGSSTIAEVRDICLFSWICRAVYSQHVCTAKMTNDKPFSHKSCLDVENNSNICSFQLLIQLHLSYGLP